MPNYPTSLDSLANPTATTYRDDPGFELDVVISTLNDIAEQVETKVGVGGSNQSPVAGRVLGADGTGTSSWRQVATGDIAANATSQGSDAVGSTSGPTTTSASLVDMPDMTVTLTLVAGSEVEVTLWAVVSNSTLGAVESFSIRDDTAGVDGTSYSINAPVAGYGHIAEISARYTGLAAGSRTFKGRWSTNSGTLTASGGLRRLRVREFRK
jgi:hypothetical protein